MNAFINTVLQFFFTLSHRQRVAVVAGLSGLLFVAIYFGILSPYIHSFKSTLSEWKSEQNLLNARHIRLKAMHEMDQASHEFDGILADLDTHFFNATEADFFIKSLPSELTRFGNVIVELKPKNKANDQSRSQSIEIYLKSIPISTKEKLLKLIDQNRSDIDSGSQLQDWQDRISKMIPADKREGLKAAFGQSATDALSQSGIQKMELQLTLQGRYSGLLSVLDWAAHLGKLTTIDLIQVSRLESSPDQVETSFVWIIYIRKE